MSEYNKILVVYYSRSGKTKTVAQKIANRLKADCEELIDKRDYKGFFGFIKGGYSAIKHKTTKIQNPKYNANEYDLVVLCTPMWAGNIVPALKAYCDIFSLSKVAWVVTCADTRNDINQFPTPKASIVAYAKFGQKQINNNQIEDELNTLISKLS